MATLDIFNAKPFEMAEMTTAVNNNPYQPGFLGSLNLFSRKPIPTTAAMIEMKEGTLNLIQTSLRGSPIEEGSNQKRDVYYRETVRIAKDHTLRSDEIQNVRAFGSVSELQSMMQRIADRLNGPTG